MTTPPIETSLSILATPDGQQLTVEVTRATNPRAVMVVTHGFGEHRGRYAHFVGRVMAEHLAVVTYDLRGHGDSTGKRGHAPSYDTLLADLQQVIEHARTSCPNLPLLLFGHSMGGNITANYALRWPQDIYAVVLSAPWFKLGFEPPAWKLVLARMMGAIRPTFSLPAGVNADWLSHDLAVVRAYRNDPKVHGKISACMFLGCRDAAAWALAHAGQLRMPTLIQHGSADKLIAPAGSQLFFAGTPKRHAIYFEYPGLYHEIYNEGDGTPVWRDLFHWMSQLLAPTL